MQDLRLDNKSKSNLFSTTIGFLYVNKWWILGILGIFLGLNLIFNPIGTATMLGNWINDFFGTLVNTINY